MVATHNSSEGFNISQSDASNITDSKAIPSGNFTSDYYYNDSYNYGEFGSTFEHLYYYYLWTFITPAILGTITAIGTIGNSLVIYVILSGKVACSVTNLLLLNLAFADIAFLLIVVPITAYKYAADGWDFGDAMCKIVQYFIYVSAYVTIWSLVSVSVIRFITVVYSNSTIKIRTKRNVIMLIVFIWLVCLSINVPTLLAFKVKSINGYTYCGMHSHAIEGVFVSFFVFAYAVPLLAISIMYLLIWIHLQNATSNSSIQSRNQGRTAKACKVIVVVVLVFGISWLPMHVNYLVGFYGKLPQGAYYEAFRILWYCMAYSNSCVNPIIYNYVSNDFRKGFRQVICCRLLRFGTGRRTVDRQTETEMTQMLETKA